jgi:hypothetical protein
VTAHALRQQRSSTKHTRQPTRQHPTDVHSLCCSYRSERRHAARWTINTLPTTRELDQSVYDEFGMVFYNKGTFAKWQISSVIEKRLF